MTISFYFHSAMKLIQELRNPLFTEVNCIHSLNSFDFRKAEEMSKAMSLRKKPL